MISWEQESELLWSSSQLFHTGTVFLLKLCYSSVVENLLVYSLLIITT